MPQAPATTTDINANFKAALDTFLTAQKNGFNTVGETYQIQVLIPLSGDPVVQIVNGDSVASTDPASNRFEVISEVRDLVSSILTAYEQKLS